MICEAGQRGEGGSSPNRRHVRCLLGGIHGRMLDDGALGEQDFGRWQREEEAMMRKSGCWVDK